LEHHYARLRHEIAVDYPLSLDKLDRPPSLLRDQNDAESSAPRYGILLPHRLSQKRYGEDG
jgi:hypothetical protein